MIKPCFFRQKQKSSLFSLEEGPGLGVLLESVFVIKRETLNCQNPPYIHSFFLIWRHEQELQQLFCNHEEKARESQKKP